MSITPILIECDEKCSFFGRPQSVEKLGCRHQPSMLTNIVETLNDAGQHLRKLKKFQILPSCANFGIILVKLLV